ncbi:MAG: hypothetical protein ACFB21_07070 [Opitutales bacterium]
MRKCYLPLTKSSIHKFSDFEFGALLSVANRNRRLIYLTAAYTGLRKGEVRELCWGDCFLSGDRPYLAVRAATTKNRKEATIPLHSGLARELTEFRPERAQAQVLSFFG